MRRTPFLSEPIQFVAAWAHEVGVGRGPLHHHETHELVLHRSGRGRVFLDNGESIDFEPRSVEIIASGRLHMQEQSAKGTDICVHFTIPAEIPRQIAEITSIRVPPGGFASADIAWLLSQPPRRDPIEQRICDHRLTAVLLEIFKTAAPTSAAASSGESAIELLAVRARDWIRQNWRTIRHVEEVSAGLSVSPDYLRHAYQKRFGTSLHELLTQMRIDHAKDLLRRSHLAQKVIAETCGFADVQQFSRRFRQIVGVPPGEYQKHAAKGR